MVEVFSKATLVKEVALQAGDLASEEVAGLVGEAEEGVGGDFGLAEADFLRSERTSLKSSAHLCRERTLFFPDRQPMLAQEIFVIEGKFLQTRTGNIGELEFSFLGGAGGHTSLRDILHTAPRGLHHLIVSPGSLLHKKLTKDHGGIVGELRRLKAAEIPVAAVWRQNWVLHGELVSLSDLSDLSDASDLSDLSDLSDASDFSPGRHRFARWKSAHLANLRSGTPS
jgi:hypothetical protein